jgi:hypothetical protein
MLVVGVKLNKHRINTTISIKHWEILEKYTAKFDTQQKALEFALESLENNSKQSPISLEDQLWMRLARMRNAVSIVRRDLFREFIKSADPEKVIEATNHLKMLKYVVEAYHNKPIKNCSLKEVLDGLINVGRVVNWFDSIDYIDNNSHYTIEIIHSLGINNSKINKVMFEDLFKEYGVKMESEVTDIGIFMKVYKSMVATGVLV